MKKNNWLILLLVTAMLLSACQPTPSAPVVVNKGGNELEQAILQTAVPQPSETGETQQPSQSSSPTPTPKPEMWQENLDFKDGVQVAVDSEIIKPPVSVIPALQVAPHEITQQEAQKFVDFFMQGKPLYDDQYIPTKADIQKLILIIEENIQNTKNDKLGSEEERKSELDDLNAQLKQQEDEYSKAPAETPQPELITAEFKNHNEKEVGNYKAVEVQADLGKTRPASLGIYVYSDNFDNSVSFRNVDSGLQYLTAFEAKDTLPGLNITLKEAQVKAEETLKNLGIVNVQLASTEAGVDIKGIEKSADIKNAVSDLNRKKCYSFIFSPVYNGIPVTYAEPCYGMQSDDDGNVSFEKTWDAEEIEIRVDDTGVIGFYWNDPGDITKTVSANLKLLDFKDIQDKFRKQIFYKRAWSDRGFENTKVTVNTVKLGYMRIKMKDNTYMMLPVWDFIGEWSYSVEVYKDMEAKVPDTHVSDTKNVSFLTLNAVDGSDINRYQGY